MVYEIVVDDNCSSKRLLKESNRICGRKKNSVFCKPDSNYVISVFDKRIRISLAGNSDDKKAINDIEQYLSNLLDGKTIIVPTEHNFKATFTSLNNIHIVEV